MYQAALRGIRPQQTQGTQGQPAQECRKRQAQPLGVKVGIEQPSRTKQDQQDAQPIQPSQETKSQAERPSQRLNSAIAAITLLSVFHNPRRAPMRLPPYDTRIALR